MGEGGFFGMIDNRGGGVMGDYKEKKKRLPVGIDIFEKLIRQDFYYVDKTGLIA